MNNNKDIIKEEFGNVTLYYGNNIHVLRAIPSNSIDSCVIDPPYGIGFLGKEWDNFQPEAIQKGTVRYKKGVDHNQQTGRSPAMYSGKYDTSRLGVVGYQQWCYEWAKEVWRILKPGALLLASCSPRMYHRMVCGIEDAGFEIRDQLQWIYFSGFPKSHNISIAIDKLKGAKRIVLGENPNRIGRKNWDDKPKNITAPASAEAKYFSGWGTGLKPANEPIVLARKPISEKTVALNVIKHGTGALNIEACRIGSSGGTKAVNLQKNKGRRGLHNLGIGNSGSIKQLKKGRYPSNLILNQDIAEMFGEKAKFFYSPKVSKQERNAGCEDLEAKPQNSEGNQRTYNDRCAECGKKFIGSEQSRCQCPVGIKKTDKTAYTNKNNHPTVKPVALMEYLVKLITPKGGTCIDIFMGSGSTGIAAVNLGFKFVGIDKEPEYFEIAKARIKHAQNNLGKNKDMAA